MGRLARAPWGETVCALALMKVDVLLFSWTRGVSGKKFLFPGQSPDFEFERRRYYRYYGYLLLRSFSKEELYIHLDLVSRYLVFQVNIPT